MKNLIFLLILFFIFLFIATPKAYAITKTSGYLEVTYENPLFSSSTTWYPGLTLTKSFTVKNLDSSLQTISLESSNTSQTGNVAEIFLVKIMERATARYGGSDDKTMRNFWDAGQFNLSDLSGGGSTTYDMTITMKSSAGNSYRGKETKFDMNIGFLGTTSQVTVSGGATSDSGVVTETISAPADGFIFQSATVFIPEIFGTTAEASDGASSSGQILGSQISPSPAPSKNQVSLFTNLKNSKNILWLVFLIVLIVGTHLLWKKKH